MQNLKLDDVNDQGSYTKNLKIQHYSIDHYIILVKHIFRNMSFQNFWNKKL